MIRLVSKIGANLPPSINRFLLKFLPKSYNLLYLLSMSWLSNTSNWLKKQYFNGAHYVDALSQGKL